MPDDAQQLPTLSDADQAALQRWVREHGLGSTVSDVEPLTGGTQNIVVRVHVDGRPMVLGDHPCTRGPPVTRRCCGRSRHCAHSQGRRCRTPASSPVATTSTCSEWCSTSWRRSTVSTRAAICPRRMSAMRACGTRSVCLTPRASRSWATSRWEGKPLAELKRPGSFLERQVPQFLRLLESYRHDGYRA